MKPVVKYSVTFFILLLVGYTQVFAHFYRLYPISSSAEKAKESSHFQIPTSKALGLEEVYIEEEEKEEDDRLASKKFVGESLYLPLSNALLSDQFLESSRCFTNLHKLFTGFSFVKASYLALSVFRL